MTKWYWLKVVVALKIQIQNGLAVKIAAIFLQKCQRKLNHHNSPQLPRTHVNIMIIITIQLNLSIRVVNTKCVSFTSKRKHKRVNYCWHSYYAQLNSLREPNLSRLVIFWEIWSEWGGNMMWPTIWILSFKIYIFLCWQLLAILNLNLYHIHIIFNANISEYLFV